MKSDKVEWNLNDIIREEDFENLYQYLEKTLPQYEAWFERLDPNMSESSFLEFLRFDDKFERSFARLATYASMRCDVNSKDNEAQALKEKVKILAQKISDVQRPITQWLIGKQLNDKAKLDDENATKLFAVEPETEFSHHYARSSEQFVLSLPEERIVTHAGLVLKSPLLDLRNKITSDLRFYYRPKNEKRQVIKMQAELMAKVQSSKPNEREAAYKALLRGYEKELNKFYLIYSAIVKDWNFQSTLRGYASPISARNYNNMIPDEAVETLLSVCQSNIGIFRKYFELKGKMLGTEPLRRFDIYAPLKQAETEYTLREAVALVLDTLDEFNPNFSKHARRIINENHIHSHPKENKRNGAYCMTVEPSIAPYILLNHTNNLGSVFTLAHELGHGIHALFAAHLPESVQHAPLPFAETASTFSELVLFERLFAEAAEDERKAMLSDRISDAYGTIGRQSYFTMFEIAAHEAIPKGITAEQLSEIYWDNLQEQFGNSLDIDPMFRHEWAYISHFVNSPFYVYAYAFGELLSMALYAQYQEQGEAFLPKMENILAAGGSRNPQQVLQEVGLDMKSKMFWQGSFDILQGWQSELERLV